MKVRVDKKRCASSGNCALTVPSVFDQRPDNGVVVLLDAEPPPSLAGRLREAEDMCPTHAISIED
jgi:ferredoxin